MFDKLILLSQGNSIYFGNACDAPNYFSSIGLTPFIAMNPADFILDLASGNLSDISIPPALEKTTSLSRHCQKTPAPLPSSANVHSYLVQQFEQELLPKEKSKILRSASAKEELKLAVTAKREWSTSWLDQFSVLMMRGLKERRHEYLSYLRFVQVFFISVIVGCLWWRSKRETQVQIADQMGLIFFWSIFWGMFPLFTAIFTFPLERAMLNKERASDLYRLSSYFMARTLGDLPLDLIMPVIFVFIVYFMANLKLTAAAFFLSLLTVFLNVVTAQVCCYTLLQTNFRITLLNLRLSTQSFPSFSNEPYPYRIELQGLGFLIGAVLMETKKATTLASIIMPAFMLTGGYFVQVIT